MKIKLGTIGEKIYQRLLKSNVAMSSQEIAREFMKIERVTKDVAERIVNPILKSDSRFIMTSNGLWQAKRKVPLEKLPLSEVNFIIFYIQQTDNAKDNGFVKEEGKNKTNITESMHLLSSFILYKAGYTETISDINNLLANINNYVFIPYDLSSLNLLKMLYRTRYYLSPDILTISIKNMLKALYPEKRFRNWNDLIKEFSIVNAESDLAISKTRTVLYVLEHLFNELNNRNINTLEKLIEFISFSKKRVDFSKYSFNKDFLSNIPKFPGVYLFYDKDGKVIYIGKTNNLSRRINSYFWNTEESIEKIKGILNDLFKIEYRIMGSELEAIVEEYNLINKFKPKYNTQIKIPERTVETSKRIVLLPAIKSGESDPDMVLYFLCNGLPLLKEEFYCKKSESIINHIRDFLYSEGYMFDPAKLLVINYLRRYADNINVIEAENYGDEKAVLNALLGHCREINSLTNEKKSYY